MRSTGSRRPPSRWWRSGSTVSSPSSGSAAWPRSNRRTRRWPRSWRTRPNGRSRRAQGSVVGFRFPDASSGIEVAGYHLHFVSHDRTVAGHVLGLTLLRGSASVDGAHELHVEVPAGLTLGEPGALAEEIHAVEGGA